MTTPRTVGLGRDFDDALILAAAAEVLLTRPDKVLGDEITAAILADRAHGLAPVDPEAGKRPWSTPMPGDGQPHRHLQLIGGDRDE